MFFSRRKKEGTRGFNRRMAQELDGRAIKYVTERPPEGGELVIGREGALILKGDELLVYSSADVVFRCLVDEMHAGELMSLEGVIITAPDLEHGGAERTVTAYYTHYMAKKK